MEIPAILKNKSLIWSTVGVLILVIGIFVALQLVPKEQDIRQEAATPTGTTQVKISPVTLTMAAGEEKPATVSINTMALGIRGVSAVLSYPFTGTAPQVTAKDLTILAPFNAAPWNCNIKNIDTVMIKVLLLLISLKLLLHKTSPLNPLVTLLALLQLLYQQVVAHPPQTQRN